MFSIFVWKRYHMNFGRYKYLLTPSHDKYLFFSNGPNGPHGRVRKFVRFTFCLARDVPYYHLSFGEWNEPLQVIEDVTHHDDMEKILTTVAAIALYFTNYLLDAVIYMDGSPPTRSRDRLLKELRAFFDIYGLDTNLRWEAFQPRTHYQGFLLKRKKRVGKI